MYEKQQHLLRKAYKCSLKDFYLLFKFQNEVLYRRIVSNQKVTTTTIVWFGRHEISSSIQYILKEFI